MRSTAMEIVEPQRPAINDNAHLANSHKKAQKPRKRPMSPHLTASYPSQSLRFLQKLENSKSYNNEEDANMKRPTQARLRLSVVIVGAGLGGLSLAIALARRGHSVRILEQAATLGEVGAGIQIPPNSGRLLKRWGVLEPLQKWAVKPEAINFRRWENGNVIGYTSLGKTFVEDFEVPYYVVHRAHFHEALHQRALELGVTIQLNSRVIEYHEKKGSVVLANGSIVQGDLVVAVDGIKSRARESIHSTIDHGPRYTGFAVYRATVDVKKMREDPEIAWILEKSSLNIWLGEDRHVMTYPIAAGESFNMVLSHVDHSDPALWTAKVAKEDVEKEYSGWDPRLTKLISLVDDCMKWPLKVGTRLNSWTSPSSRLVMMGDAAHAMVPYMSQGAAMAVEDSAALAVALNNVISLDELPFALRAFETERLKRSGDMQDASNVNGKIWHFPDGLEQVARDASMEAEVAGLPFTSSANQWSDPVTQWWAYGYDAEAQMEEAWATAISGMICAQKDRCKAV